MRRRLPDALALLLLGLAAAGGLGSTCEPPAPGARPEALVVFNLNAGPDAVAIASHYASRRGLAVGQICPVSLPPGSFASKDHLLAARQTIVEQCICSLIPAASKPTPCSLANLPAVRQASPITHLVFVRGMPARLTGTGWPSDFEEPSFDFYLAYLTYRSEDIFAAGTSGLVTSTYLTPSMIEQSSQLMILSAPPLTTSVHQDVAYGRIEAIDLPRTLELIDRTLEAERLGVTGSFLEERYGKGFRFLQDLTGSHAPECTAYLTYEPFFFGAPASSWPHASCRAGTTWTTAKGPDPGSTADDAVRSLVPGGFMSTVPDAVRAGLFLGSAPNPNGHAGFNDFASLTHWRKTASACTPLCASLPTQAERDACAAASTDWFRELDTSCVGAARGLLGHQVRSYPVQYYGFWPPGWETRSTGSVEKTPPEIRSGGAFQDGSYPDDRFLHFGRRGVGEPDTASCTLAGGGVAPCPERIAVDLEKTLSFAPALPVDAPRWYLLRFRLRNAASPNGVLRASLTFSGGAAPVVKQASVSLASQASTWTTVELPFSIDPAEAPQISSLTVAFSAGLADSLVGFLDLDGVELYDLADLVQRIPPEAGSFDPPARNVTHWGDWAANAIDRLGAVAWWGSSSHHLTSGWGLSDDTRFYGAFFMGRTLGESLLLTTGGESSAIYGDPLYRPVAVRIHIPGRKDYGAAPGLTVTSAELGSLGTVLLEVLHGTDRAATVRWSLSSCPLLDITQCQSGSLWTERLSGTGARTAYPVDWTSFVDLGTAQDLLLRLRVWNPGEEGDELFHHAYLHYVP